MRGFFDEVLIVKIDERRHLLDGFSVDFDWASKMEQGQHEFFDI